ncbi:MAG: hypothetical protein HKN39_05030 [Flavobacteriales bacterium]|nr:hypothetical protein [Flavobacteriales bacterium]
MTKLYRTFVFSILLILSSTMMFGQFYNGSNQEFGKNRVQFKEFIWQYYQFDKFDVYFYEGGMDLAKHVAQIGEEQIKDIENRLDFVLQDKIEFVIYNSQTDFKQSNVGLTNNTDYNIGGTTQIVGSKVFFYYEGEYGQLLENLRKGIAEVLINQMMYGGNWKEVFKNATLLNLPDWYINGLISWVADPNDPEVNNFIKDGIYTGKFDKFNWLTGDEATQVGHAIWQFIDEVYGSAVIPNILYMSRISRNVESGYLFVLGMSLKTLSLEFQDYYGKKYKRIDSRKRDVGLDLIEYKARKKHTYSQLKQSPFGDMVAFVSNVMGQYRVFVLDVETGKQKKIAKGQHKLERLVDKSWPIVAWSPTGDELAYIIEKRGELYMHIYNVSENKTYKRQIFNLDKILDMSYSHDGRQMIFSGVKNGQTDLYLYYLIGNRQERITNDFFEEVDPQFIKNSSRVIFSSNRINDTLSIKNIDDISENRDIFVMNLSNRKVLERITSTPLIDEVQPAQYDSIRYTFLGNEKGFYNRYLATYDSAISRVDTTIHYRYFTHVTQASDLKRNISEYDVNYKRKQFTHLIFQDGKYQFYSGALSNRVQEIQFDGEQGSIEKDRSNTVNSEVISVPADEEDTIDIKNYNFGNEEDVTYEQQTIQIGETKEEKSDVIILGAEEESNKIVIPGARNYNVNFTTDFALTQVGNSFNASFYQPLFNSASTGSVVPGLGGLIKLGISDLFEDYKIVGGFRLGLRFDNNEYMLQYQNLRKRMDKIIQFERLANRQIDLSNPNGNVQFKTHIHVLRFKLSYPINEVLRVGGELKVRNDRTAFLANDILTLLRPNRYLYQGGGKIDLVFDNTLNLGLNLLSGSRFKLWGEYFQQFDRKESDFFVLGADFRHYQKIHRNFIFAGRLAGSTSFGSERLLYMLGGVDYWFSPKFTDPPSPIATDQNYQYVTMGTPVRGFLMNVRNGNSFAVANAELRLPVFKYFLNRPLRSDLLENFQIIGFSDVGSAWTGPDPYSEENSFNTNVINNNPLTITLQGRNEPLVGGYGFGLRSRILGYFLRADWAWGIENGVVQSPVFYFSASLDF